MSKTFEDLIAWQKAHEFTLAVYRITKTFPKEELFGITSQFRRAAVSIAANIAEGYKKLGKADKLRFFNIAQGSLEECRYYIILTKDIELITENDKSNLLELLNKTSFLLNAYCKAFLNQNEQ
ncbi:MAG: four helix bundle protein [Bacteroidales bacterium]